MVGWHVSVSFLLFSIGHSFPHRELTIIPLVAGGEVRSFTCEVWHFIKVEGKARKSGHVASCPGCSVVVLR